MPYVADARELRQQAYEDKLLNAAKWVSIVSIVLTIGILKASGGM